MSAKVECPYRDDPAVFCAYTFEAPTKAEVLRILAAHVQEDHDRRRRKEKDKA